MLFVPLGHLYCRAIGSFLPVLLEQYQPQNLAHLGTQFQLVDNLPHLGFVKLVSQSNLSYLNISEDHWSHLLQMWRLSHCFQRMV